MTACSISTRRRTFRRSRICTKMTELWERKANGVGQILNVSGRGCALLSFSHRGPIMTPRVYPRSWRGPSASSFDTYHPSKRYNPPNIRGWRQKSFLFLGWRASLWRRDAGAGDARRGLKDHSNAMTGHRCWITRWIWGIRHHYDPESARLGRIGHIWTPFSRRCRWWARHLRCSAL